MKIDQRCPKCGHDDTNLHYYNVGEEITGSAVKPCKEFCGEITDPHMTSYIRARVVTECIHLHCRTCQYGWASDVVDNDPSGTTYETAEPMNAFGLDVDAIKKLAEELNAPFGPPFFNEGNDTSAGDPDEFIYPSTSVIYIDENIHDDIVRAFMK